MYTRPWPCTRRELLRGGLAGLGVMGGLGTPGFFGRTARALAAESPESERILVVLELSGGNDGLNTLVPYGDDAYYRRRPTIGLKSAGLRKIDEHVRLESGDGGLRAPVQGRQAGDRARVRVRQPVILAFLLDGVLAHGRAQQRR